MRQGQDYGGTSRRGDLALLFAMLVFALLALASCAVLLIAPPGGM